MALQWSGCLWGCRQPVARDVLLVLAYHRIWPGSRPGATVFDDWVYGGTQAALRKQWRWLRRRYRLLSEGDLLRSLDRGALPPGPCLMITFDDGYRDFYDVVLPVVREMDVPVTLFIPSHRITSREVGWWDINAYLVKKAAPSRLTYAGQAYDLSRDRDRLRFAVQERLKQTPPREAGAVLHDLTTALGVAPPTREEQDRELMTWEQVRAGAREGVTIGSHTRRHFLLSVLDEQEQKIELEASKAEIENAIGQAVNAISYPVGSLNSYSPDTLRLARAAGYRLGFSFNTGINRWARIDPLQIARTEMEAHPSITYAASVFPALFGVRARRLDVAGAGTA